VFKRQTLTFHF